MRIEHRKGECENRKHIPIEAAKRDGSTLYIGEPKDVYTEEKYITDNKLDIKKVNPFTLTMPDNTYWSIGENIGNSNSKSKRYLRWLRCRLLDVLLCTTASPPPRRLDIISDLEPE